MEDIKSFNSWKIETEKCLQTLEKELNARNQVDEQDEKGTVVSEQALVKFQQVKDQMNDLPVFDSETFQKI